MLAEPKLKTVWSVNPRGNVWFNDKNKFGQKLMENMGWKEGNGLGKHENGIKQHIKVNSNVNNKGLGYKSSDGHEWIDDNNEYEKILRHLSERYDTINSKSTNSIINLEEKAKNFRNRVHYRSFIRAKNLSNYSENDIKSIFPQTLKTRSDEHLKSEELKERQFTSKMNLNQYFSLKMKKIKDLNAEQAMTDLDSDGLSAQTFNTMVDIENNESNLNDDCMEGCIATDIDMLTNQNNQFNKEKEGKRKNSSNKTDKNDATIKNISPKKVKLNKHSCSENSTQLVSNTNNAIESESRNNVVIKNRYASLIDCKAVNASQSVYNYDEICDAITKDKFLNTTNLSSICGYGIS